MSYECPRCGGSIKQVHRRLIDRPVSMVIPFKRFRCRDHGCCWEGNLRGAKRANLARIVVWIAALVGALVFARLIVSIGN